MDESPFVVICGPTAVGKTEVAIKLAHRLGGEVINADSMQIYRGMDIGTAKPALADREGVVFHLLDLIEPDQLFTVAEWKRLAESAIQEIQTRGHLPILCGGTGMYLRALLENWSFAETPRDPEVRRQLEMEVRERGAPTLHQRLQGVDPVAAARLHPNDAIRIVRALEVYLVSHMPLSEHLRRDQSSRSLRHAVQIGLTMPRERLYPRIERRVDSMLEQGLIYEVSGLLSRGFHASLSPMKSLGYKEIALYLGGELDLDTAISLIKQNTRRYAKRQQTWFRTDPALLWIDMAEISSAKAVDMIEESLHPRLQEYTR